MDREWIRALHGLLRDGGGVSERKELVAKLLAARRVRAKNPPQEPAAPKTERVAHLSAQGDPQSTPPEAPGLRLTPPSAELPEPMNRAKDWKAFEPPLEEELAALPPLPVPEPAAPQADSEQIEPSGEHVEPVRQRSFTESLATLAFVILMVVVALMLIRLLL